jgi:hypothetical protein
MIFVNVSHDLHARMHFMTVMAHRNIKISSFLILVCTAVSCITGNKSTSLVEEDNLYLTRFFVGNFLSYQHTTADSKGNPDLIWITTSRDSIHGKISAYGKECHFTPGERLYLRRVLTENEKSEAWVYRIENADTVNYMLNEYQAHKRGLAEAWLGAIPENPTGSPPGSPVTSEQKTTAQKGSLDENK